MKIVEQSYRIYDDLNQSAILKKLDYAARTCYQSHGSGSAERLITSCIQREHESVLEHVSFTVDFILSRAIADELMRHRHLSPSTQSTRYVSQKNDVIFIQPSTLKKDTFEYKVWFEAMAFHESRYHRLLQLGVKPEVARGVLPLDVKTQTFCSANLREWRHILKLRTNKSSHPDMVVIMTKLLDELKEKLPVFFLDI